MFRYISIVACLCITACSLENPANKSGDLSEYEYSYWLLDRNYYFDDMPAKDAYTEPESLFAAVKDPYTRYIVPQKADDAQASMETSINNGSIGIELAYNGEKYPLIINRIYPGSSTERAKVPRYATLLEVNGVSLENDDGTKYSDATAKCDSVVLKYASGGDTATVELQKENILAPTVFLDTLQTGNPIITLRKFAKSSSNKLFGTIGELDSIVKKLQGTKHPVVIDLRNNPGGIISQCAAAADVFLEKGVIMKTHTKGFNAAGDPIASWDASVATEGGIGEQFKILLFTNGKSASCAEIFSMALKQSERVHHTGTKTYGKGIGQRSWKTPRGALVYITNAMVYNDHEETYHGKGIDPDYPCETANWTCLYKAIASLYSTAKSKVANDTEFFSEPIPILPNIDYLKSGGAIFE